MEPCEKQIINTNLDKLIPNTSCNTTFLDLLQASGVFNNVDVNALNAHSSNKIEQVTQFYKLIQTKAGGYQMLLKVLKETKQTGALSILNKIPSQYDPSFHYDDDATARLGKGKFGTVFKGKWKNRKVAVKRVMHTDETKKARIENEVDILRICDKHSNIIRYFDIKNFEYFDLIVLEFCDITLKHWVADRTKVQIPRRNIMKKVTKGLEWLHKRRILYLNLKPENTLLNAEPPCVKLAGFASSVRLKNGEKVCQVPLGVIDDTFCFEAPERRRNSRECSFASDVYSLGSLFLFVLTDGRSNLKDVESLGNLENTMNETNEANKCVNDILTIKSMTLDDPQSRPTSSELLSTSIIFQRYSGEDDMQETDDFNHPTDPPLLRFIKHVNHSKFILTKNENH
ncbi:unnamed protein product [Orchesella dallaii]|uniref:Protein kinase domain-containing protein n=1 Tax=Orchesella dallaii TaxID=48710 RepID=A0ABP1RQL2_9HEXA